MKVYKGFRNTAYVDYTVTEKDVDCISTIKYIKGSNCITVLFKTKLKADLMVRMIDEVFNDHYKIYPIFQTKPQSYFTLTEAKYIEFNYKGCKTEENKEKRLQKAIDQANDIANGPFKDELIEAFVENMNRRIANSNETYMHETIRFLDCIPSDYITEMANTEDLDKEIKDLEEKLELMKQDSRKKKNSEIIRILEESSWLVDGIDFTEEIKEEIRKQAKNGNYF